MPPDSKADTNPDEPGSTTNVFGLGRRPLLKAVGAGAGLTLGGGVVTAGGDSDQGEASEHDHEDDPDGDRDGHFVEDLIDPTFGYPLAAEESDDVELDHTVELFHETGDASHEDFPQLPEPEAEDPGEFYFDPVGLQVTPDTLVQFRIDSGEHTVTAFHEKFSVPQREIRTRVPDDVPGFTSPPILDGESWIYQFPSGGVYDVLCLPHLFFGMVMRVVVFDSDEDDIEDDAFAAPTDGELPPNANAVLTADELDPENIVDEGTVAWEDLTLEAPEMPESNMTANSSPI